MCLLHYLNDPDPVRILIKLSLFQVRGTREAMTIQDWAAQRCTISYRAPELFNVESHCIIDERTDIWVKPCIFHPLRLVYFVQVVLSLKCSILHLLLLFCLPILLQSLGCVLYCMMMLEGPYDMVFQKGDSVALAVQNPVAIPQSCRLVLNQRFHQSDNDQLRQTRCRRDVDVTCLVK